MHSRPSIRSLPLLLANTRVGQCRSGLRLRLRYNSSVAGEQNQTDAGVRPPFPFLWPSLPQPPDTAPRTLTPIVTGDPKSIFGRIYIQLLSLPVRFPHLNRVLNIGWISMLLTKAVFPKRFIRGSVLAFEEFLRRLRVGEDTSELLTPEFSKILYDHLGSATSPSNLEDGASMSLTTDGEVLIRDSWLFLGPTSAFAESIGKSGGLLKTKDTHDPKSKTLFLQLPFTSILAQSHQDSPLAPEAADGLMLAVDVEIRGTFRYAYRGNEMTQERKTIVRFVSQAFEARRCVSTDEKNQRIFSIRDRIMWKIGDIDYIWSTANQYEH